MRYLTPVAERQLIAETDAGSLIEKLVIEKAPEGYRLIIFVGRSKNPLTIGKHRGGVRFWRQIDSLLTFVEKNLPRFAGAGWWSLASSSEPPDL